MSRGRKKERAQRIYSLEDEKGKRKTGALSMGTGVHGLGRLLEKESERGCMDGQ